MTKKLESLFELAIEEHEHNELHDPLPECTKDVTETALNTLEKIENSLPQVKNLEKDDRELDELADLATASYKDLVDLGLQVESRFSSDIFQAAGTMLGHAITAKTAKINKKLKQLDLQMKHAALEAKKADRNKEVEALPIGEGRALDRNELLKMLLEKKDTE